MEDEYLYYNFCFASTHNLVAQIPRIEIRSYLMIGYTWCNLCKAGWIIVFRNFRMNNTELYKD